MKSESAEREEYKNRLSRQKTAIANLLEIASEHSRLFTGEMISQLEKRREESERLYKKIENNEFEIAIIGLEKAGKSTFANALIENRILPDADERCTYTSTCIKAGSNIAVVKFYNIDEFNKNFRLKLESMNIPDVENYSVESLSLEEYKHIFSELDQSVQEAHETKTNKDIINILTNRNDLLKDYLGKPDSRYEGEDLKSSEFKNFIVKKEVAIAVKEVSIESDRLGKMKNAIIYDVPGFDSPTQMHEDQTLEKMKKADAIVLIASAKSPSFTGPALKVFGKADEDQVELSDKLFVFGNRADEANTLEKNIRTLKSELMDAKLLKESNIERRTFFGSAKAHLQSCGQEGGTDCADKIKTCTILEHGDGIDYIKEKLEEYNANERFQVLKRKVNENDKEIIKLFEKLREEYNEDNSFKYDIKEILKVNIDLAYRSRATLKNSLENMRNEIRTGYNENKKLSNSMVSEIEKLFNDEEFKISEYEIETARKRIGGTSPSINVEEVEINIRESKFNYIYKKFSETVLKIAVDDHNKYFNEVIDAFCDALGVKRKSENYEVISEKIEVFLDKSKRNMENTDYYQSLIERFVRDLVEILIKYPYRQEARLNKFLYELKNYIGLIMFYNNGNYEKTFLSMAPKDQLLIYALLFHEFKNVMSESNNIMEYMGNISKDVLDSPEIIALIVNIIKKNPIGAFAALKNIVKKESFKSFKGDELLQEIVGNLKGETKKIKSEDSSEDFSGFDFSNETRFIQQYKQYFSQGSKVKEYEDFINDYDTDLDILKDFLISASIPAICIEKPFIAREVKSLSDILAILETEEYCDFLIENAELFHKENFEEINIRQEERILNKKIVIEIENVLKSMTSSIM